MKYPSSAVSILVDGYDLTPALAESITAPSPENITQQTNAFGAGAEGHSPVGVTKATLVVAGGVFDKAVDPLHAAKVPDGGVGVLRVVCVTVEGQAKGYHFTGCEGAYSQKSDVLPVNSALTKANVAYEVSGQVDENAVILQELASKTADWDTEATPVDAAADPTARRVPITSSSAASPSHIVTTDPHGFVTGDVVAIFNHTSVTPDINDNPVAAEAWKLIGHSITVIDANTFSIPVNVTDGGVGGYVVLVSRASGGWGYQQVTQGSGFTAFVGKVRHSADKVTFADLITFTDTGIVFHVAERKATATPTTRVNRYLAYKGDVTGTVGATPFKAFGGFARGA